MSATDRQRVQDALDAAIAGDVDPLVALLAPDLEWRGVERGHLWWRSAPS
jgi:ketosteroid isomerase-like protein